MLTIFDYVKCHKDVSLDELPWNLMDNLVCTILVYLPTCGFKNQKILSDIYEEVKFIDNPEKLGIVEPKSIELAKLLLDSRRYMDLRVSNFVKLKNENTQFGAVTFRIRDNTVVSFQGTDYSTIGWLENFRIAYEYPTYTQNLAAEYLNNTLNLSKDNNIYVLGHSKGGNLAMASVMECSDIIYDKIKRIYNFEGPGFREVEYTSEKYKKMSEKLINFVPSTSVIGILMNNKDYHVIKPNCIGFNGHFPINWGIEGCTFIKGELSYVSRQIHKSTTVGFKDIDNDTIKDAIENMFDALGEDKALDIKVSIDSVITVYNKLKKEKPKVFECLDIIFNSIIDAIKDKNDFDIRK